MRLKRRRRNIPEMNKTSLLSKPHFPSLNMNLDKKRK
jgi:hypothetical protein